MKDRWFVGFTDNFSAKSVVQGCCARAASESFWWLKRGHVNLFLWGMCRVVSGVRKLWMMRPLFATKSRFIFKEGSGKGHIAELPIIRSWFPSFACQQNNNEDVCSTDSQVVWNNFQVSSPSSAPKVRTKASPLKKEYLNNENTWILGSIF